MESVELNNGKPKETKSEEGPDAGPPRYTKSVLWKGDEANFPKKRGPEWAYGKKGQPDAKIPPNAKLIIEVGLVDTDWNQGFWSEDIKDKNLALKLNVTN